MISLYLDLHFSKSTCRMLDMHPARKQIKTTEISRQRLKVVDCFKPTWFQKTFDSSLTTMIALIYFCLIKLTFLLDTFNRTVRRTKRWEDGSACSVCVFCSWFEGWILLGHLINCLTSTKTQNEWQSVKMLKCLNVVRVITHK